ncbi:zinc-dependent alcohol dehydrogenase family protein [Nocardiopsis sp. MG754419]|uniref:zinc-dependent alcohol dehydrogenase family protein n=1 Tax=Nocardiopsis sp. MG754419 TaxID=2259865 RepID=UPI001BA45E27|nr:zinc-dependent alcohol dehydrogenase family protein [Nocardiopsis sp. MG754419]MBR8743426.1 Zn-dependent oxidoreductase [Nocardiopsis sp. MG754419]
MDFAWTAIADAPGAAHLVTSVRRESVPTRRQGFVRVRMLAAAINPSDLITISGAYARTVFPFRAGFEGVGVVTDADPGCGFAIGDRVVPIRSSGAWSTLRDVRVQDCVPVPPTIPDEQAATSFVNPLTALNGVERFVTDHRPVVITAASSTIADHFAALLRLRGVPPVGVVRNGLSRIRRPHLWKTVIRADRPDWTDRLHQASAGASVVFDAVGGTHAVEVATAVHTGRTKLVGYGLLSGRPIDSTRLPAGTEPTFLHLRSLVHGGDQEGVRDRFAVVFSLIENGTLSTDIARRFPFDQVRAALAWSGTHTGKALLRFSNDDTGGSS